jgi:hypothetical protein
MDGNSGGSQWARALNTRDGTTHHDETRPMIEGSLFFLLGGMFIMMFVMIFQLENIRSTLDKIREKKP